VPLDWVALDALATWITPVWTIYLEALAEDDAERSDQYSRGGSRTPATPWAYDLAASGGKLRRLIKCRQLSMQSDPQIWRSL